MEEQQEDLNSRLSSTAKFPKPISIAAIADVLAVIRCRENNIIDTSLLRDEVETKLETLDNKLNKRINKLESLQTSQVKNKTDSQSISSTKMNRNTNNILWSGLVAALLIGVGFSLMNIKMRLYFSESLGSNDYRHI